jgi:hypothetical protein
MLPSITILMLRIQKETIRIPKKKKKKHCFAANICWLSYFILFFYFYIGGWIPYWVLPALRRLLLAYCTCPGWLWGWRSWWTERFWQGKPKYSEKTCPDAIVPTTNPTCHNRARGRAAAVGNQRLTASAMARPAGYLTIMRFVRSPSCSRCSFIDRSCRSVQRCHLSGKWRMMTNFFQRLLGNGGS